MKNSHLLSLATACTLAVGVAPSTNAATIAWDVAMDTTSASSVSTTGSLVKAFNSGGTSTTVNGVTFAQAASAGDDVYDSFTAVLSSPGSFDAFDDFNDLGELDLLLRTANYIGTPNGSYTITLQDLNIGTNYELQLFFMDQRGRVNSPPAGCVGCNDREVTFTSGANSVTLEADPGNTPTAPYGQFALGAFTADAATQGFTISGIDVQQVNAWQLRAAVVPVPAAVWLFGSGLLGMIGVARRKKAA